MENEWVNNLTVAALLNWGTRNLTEIVIAGLVAGVMVWMWRRGNVTKAAIAAKAGEAKTSVREKVRILRLQYFRSRGYVMGRKQKHEREQMERELIALRQLIVIEQAWCAGEISNATYHKLTEDLAYRFRDPSMFAKNKLPGLKKAIKAKRKALGQPMTLKEAAEAGGLDPKLLTNTKGEGETKLTFQKVA